MNYGQKGGGENWQKLPFRHICSLDPPWSDGFTVICLCLRLYIRLCVATSFLLEIFCFVKGMTLNLGYPLFLQFLVSFIFPHFLFYFRFVSEWVFFFELFISIIFFHFSFSFGFLLHFWVDFLESLVFFSVFFLISFLFFGLLKLSLLLLVASCSSQLQLSYEAKCLLVGWLVGW